MHCSSTFKSKVIRGKHIEAVHEYAKPIQREYICSTCLLRFSQKSLLSLHIQCGCNTYAPDEKQTTSIQSGPSSEKTPPVNISPPISPFEEFIDSCLDRSVDNPCIQDFDITLFDSTSQSRTT